MEELTKRTNKNYEIVSQLIFDTIKEKGTLNSIYLQFYHNNFLKNVIMIYDYDIEKLSDKLIDLYQTLRNYNIDKITKLDTNFTTTIKLYN